MVTSDPVVIAAVEQKLSELALSHWPRPTAARAEVVRCAAMLRGRPAPAFLVPPSCRPEDEDREDFVPREPNGHS
jgi:hypothetical protein